MLKVLIKHEVRQQGRTMLGIYGILAAAAVLVFIASLAGRIAGSGIAPYLFSILGVIYLATVMISAAAGFIYLCLHFYKSMFSAQGYLTHTLPVKTSEILHVKIAVSAASLFLMMLACMLSVALSGAAWDGISIPKLFGIFVQAYEQTGRELGIHGAVLVMYLAGILLLSCFASLLLFFAGSSIGQLAHRSKGVCGIAAGIGLYYLQQITTVIVLAVIAAGIKGNTGIGLIAGWVMAGVAAALLFWIVVFYMICRVIVQKHLNLE